MYGRLLARSLSAGINRSYSDIVQRLLSEATILSDPSVASHTVTRASQATHPITKAAVANNVGRYIDISTPAGSVRGVFVEGARTRVNTEDTESETVAVSATTYSLSVQSGSATVSAGTATATGYGTATSGNPVTLVVTGAGNVALTATAGAKPQIEAGTYPSTYIPGAGAGVTRAREQIDMVTDPISATAGSAVVLYFPFNHAMEPALFGTQIVGLLVDKSKSRGFFEFRNDVADDPFRFEKAITTGSGSLASLSSPSVGAGGNVGYGAWQPTDDLDIEFNGVAGTQVYMAGGSFNPSTEFSTGTTNGREYYGLCAYLIFDRVLTATERAALNAIFVGRAAGW